VWGVEAFIDRSLILSTHTKNSISCLENQRDIRNIQVQRQGKPTLDLARQVIVVVVEKKWPKQQIVCRF
jgi:hypothetical protein